MAQKFLWPSAQFPAHEQEAARPPVMGDSLALAAAFGPELTRIFGTRCTARLLDTPDQTVDADILVARVRIPMPESKLPATLDMWLPEAGCALLLEILFGGQTPEAGDAFLPPLPPASASWMALSRFMASCMARALGTVGRPTRLPPEIPPRPRAMMDAIPQAMMRLDIEGATTYLALRGLEAKPPVDENAPDPVQWRSQAKARTFDLELPVSLRLADTRVPVGQIASLRVGDILPLASPDSVEVLAGGRRLGAISANHFTPRPHSDDPSDSEELVP